MSRLIFDRERQKVPIRAWARSMADDTVAQLERVASQPYVVDAVCAMADAHVSDGVAVGTVFATENTVVPRALGGDLGCGMSAIRIDAPEEILDRRVLARALAELGRAIPAGDGVHRGAGTDVPSDVYEAPLSTHTLERQRHNLARRHLGTLGGGNHFIELDRAADGAIWLLVHSGSRGLGAVVAAHHARAAASTSDASLAGLDVREPAGAAYLRDLAFALEFARINRARLLLRALEVLAGVVELCANLDGALDVHHNFVATERWLGRPLLVHRKGAVAAPVGARALVPGSMGTASYIVEGLGNAESFGSCSHGAGRVMSRKEAHRSVRPADLRRSMRRVVYPEHLEDKLVDEAPSAYRDIKEVLEDQDDLVRRVTRLEPIMVLKG